MTKETFTEQLRRLDESDLDPYQFRLLAHYWRRGRCWETLRTTAKSCKMSLSKAHETRQWLFDNAWIELQPIEIRPGKTKMAIVICSLHEQTQQLNCSPDEQCSPQEQVCSPDEQKPVDFVRGANAILNEPNYINEPTEMEVSPSLWSDTLAELQHQMVKATFDLNLAGSALVAFHENGAGYVAEIRVKDQDAADRVNNRLAGVIGRTLSAVAGKDVAIEARPPRLNEHGD